MKARKSGSYVYHHVTQSLCEHCDELIPAKVVEQHGCIYLQKRCPEHGRRKVRISSDAAYWHLCRQFRKPGDRTLVRQTKVRRGCPWDCGLCPDHEQHACVALVEITDACNLECPVCFANSSPHRNGYRTLEEVEFMLDAIVASEGIPDIVQISGGEPTIHPQIMQILELASRKPIRHLMLNTNGVRLARDKSFAEALSQFGSGLEIYLQFDSLNDDALQDIRGASLARLRLGALENLQESGLSTTLVVTVKAGVNDNALGDIVNFATGYPCIRGVTFQALQDAGRNPGFDPAQHRTDLAGIRRSLLNSSGILSAEDIVPLPCNPGQMAVAYCIRNGESLVPVTSLLPREELVGSVPNTVVFEEYPDIRKRLIERLSVPASPDKNGCGSMRRPCCLPVLPDAMSYEHVFRISIIEFLDRHNFCLGAVKRSCIHIVHPDGRIIPFDTFNLFHRMTPGVRPVSVEAPGEVRSSANRGVP